MPQSSDFVNAGALCPADVGYDAESFDLHSAGGTAILGTAGSVYGSQIIVRNPFPVTNLVAHITTAGGTLTSNDCWGLLFDNAGNLIGQTGDQHTAWATAGLQTMAFSTTSPGTIQPGKYWGAVVATGTTLPTFATASAPLLLCNVGRSAASARFGILDTSITSTPASITPSSIAVTNALCIWMALN